MDIVDKLRKKRLARGLPAALNIMDAAASEIESLRSQLQQSEARVKELELAIPPLISWLKFDGSHNHDTIMCVAQDVETAERLLATHVENDDE